MAGQPLNLCKGQSKDYLLNPVASLITTYPRLSAAMRLPIRLIEGQPLYKYKGTVQRLSLGSCSLLYHHLPEAVSCKEVTNQIYGRTASVSV
jgi:hypothetical protein